MAFSVADCSLGLLTGCHGLIDHALRLAKAFTRVPRRLPRPTCGANGRPVRCLFLRNDCKVVSSPNRRHSEVADLPSRRRESLVASTSTSEGLSETATRRKSARTRCPVEVPLMGISPNGHGRVGPTTTSAFVRAEEVGLEEVRGIALRSSRVDGR